MSNVRLEKVLSLARRTTRLDDFGDDDFLEPLDLLLKGYSNTADLNWLGRIATQIYLHRMLSNRLRLQGYFKCFPVASKIKIERPIFILGLPRTGSTLLHELMACHRDLRAPTFWEATFVPGHSAMDRCRQLTTALKINFINALSPGFKSVHKLGTFRPHECITLQAASLRTMQFHAVHNVSDYNAWLETCDWQPAYDMHKRCLQWLQFNGGAQRWVLKAPGHMLSIEALNCTYPDALFIQLHRDPCEVIPSMASLFCHLRTPFANRVNLKEIGQDVTRQWQLGLSSTMQQRAANSKLDYRFLDISYRDLVSNPLARMREIMAFCNLNSSETSSQIFEDYLAQNPKGKHGDHRYSLDQFGLSRNALEGIFADYKRQYAL